MNNPILVRYKILLLIALVVSLGIIALGNVSVWYEAVFIILGGMLGMVFLDLEYVIEAYLTNTTAPTSVALKKAVTAGKFNGFVKYIIENEKSYTDLPIRSVLFQVLLLIFGYYIVFTHAFPFAISMILTMMGVMLYDQAMELAQTGNLKRWFWVYNGDVSQKGAWAYVMVMFALFILLFTFI